MNTMKKLLFCTAAASLLSACGGNNKPQEEARSNNNGLDIYKVEDCYWADKTKGAPAWSCNYLAPDKNFAIFAVGKSPTSRNDATLSRNKALADGQAELQRQIEAKVEKGFKEASVTTGAIGTDDETLDTATKQVLNNMIKGSLNNTRVLKELAGPDGYTYILVGVAKDGFADMISSSVKSSMGNQKSQYQMFVADKIQKEFDAEFDAYNKQ